MKKNWVFLNHKFLPENEAFISITDRGFLFGDGFFTTIRVNQGDCEFFNEHIARLHQHAKILNIDLPEISHDWIKELILRNQAQIGVWKLKILFTCCEIEKERKIGNFLISLNPYEEISINPLKLCIFPHPFQIPLGSIKSLSYANHCYIREYAKVKGYDDAIRTTENKFLLETSTANLFWIDERGCWIPDFETPYLQGIILDQVIKNLNIPIHFVQARLEDIPLHANVYVCNSLIHVRPVESIEERLFQRNKKNEEIICRIFSNQEKIQ